MIGSDQIIDDLKQAVVNKFPNTLARHFDPAEIQILVRAGQEKVLHCAMKSKEKKYNRNNGLSGDEQSGQSINGEALWQDSESFIILAPDQNVWEVMNEYWGGTMTIEDAFIVDADTNESVQQLPNNEDSYPIIFQQEPLHKLQDKLSLLQLRRSNTRSPISSLEQVYHYPRPQYPLNNTMARNSYTKNFSASPSFANRVGLAQPNSTKQTNTMPPVSTDPFTSPVKNPSSQPVLLLPRNFSLGEQHGKSVDVDEAALDSVEATRQKHKMVCIGSENDAVENDTTDEAFVHRPKPESGLAGSCKEDKHSGAVTVQKTHSDHQKTVPIAKHASIPYVSGTAPRTLDVKPLQLKDNPHLATFEKVLPLISVLVVEDNSINQAILGAFLRKHKIHYHIAKNGQEAVDKWRKGGFHLVLMDIQLPVKSGIEATKEIRNLEKINRIGVFAQHELAGTVGLRQEELTEDQKLDLDLFRSPVIIVALTASSNSSVDKKNALTAGCNDFLTKPVNLVWLQNKITEWGCMQALIDFDGWKDKRTLAFSSSGKDMKVVE